MCRAIKMWLFTNGKPLVTITGVIHELSRMDITEAQLMAAFEAIQFALYFTALSDIDVWGMIKAYKSYLSAHNIYPYTFRKLYQDSLSYHRIINISYIKNF